jgi:hypothetical protein
MPSAPGWVYIRRKKTKAGQPGLWPEKKKIETVLTYMTTGSATKTCMVTGIPVQTIYSWKKHPWWKEMEQQLRDEDSAELDTKYTKIIKKTLDVIEDRLENGDFVLDRKSGAVNRVPVNIRDTNKVLTDVAVQRTKLRDQSSGPTERQETVNDKLVKLASQFAEMALGKKKTEKIVGEVYEGDFEHAVEQERETGLQNRVCEVSGNGQSQESTCSTQQSAVNDG